MIGAAIGAFAIGEDGSTTSFAVPDHSSFFIRNIEAVLQKARQSAAGLTVARNSAGTLYVTRQQPPILDK